MNKQYGYMYMYIMYMMQENKLDKKWKQNGKTEQVEKKKRKHKWLFKLE